MHSAVITVGMIGIYQANLKKKDSLNSHLIKGLDPIGVSKKLINSSYGFNYGDFNQLKKLVNEKKLDYKNGSFKKYFTKYIISKKS